MGGVSGNYNTAIGHRSDSVTRMLQKKYKGSYRILVPKKFYNETLQGFRNLGVTILSSRSHDISLYEIYVQVSEDMGKAMQEAVDEVVKNNKLSTRIGKMFNKSRDFFFNMSSDAFEFTASKIIKQHEQR